MSRRGIAGVLITGLMCVCSPQSSVRAAEIDSCDEGSWTGGTTEWCDGWLVYRDYVYDDAGAEEGGMSPHGSGFDRPDGDVDHRDHGQSLNSADLLALRVRARDGELDVRFELNTLFGKDKTIAALAIDADGNQKTGGGPWKVVDAASEGWEHVYRFTKTDVETNVITGRVPLPKVEHTVRFQAAVALGDGTVMNVAFRPTDHGRWWEEEQAAALAAGDISRFGATVSRADLLGGAHRPAEPPRSGYFERVYRSAYPISEGVDYAGVAGPTTATYHYLGRHQPYAIYVPPGPAPHGAQLVLHGSGANHSTVIRSANFQRVMGQELNRILISPLGRGPDNFYVDWGARDTLDALADVLAHYGVDRDRVFISGYSMGGAGTMQLATAYPDLFAGAIAWVPFTGDHFNATPLAQGRQHGVGALEPIGGPYFSNDPQARSGYPLGGRGNALDYMDSLRHVPVGYLFGAADELVRANHAVAVAQRAEELGYPHRVWTHAAEHFTFIALDDWRKESKWTAGRLRVRHPARVTYRTNTFLWTPELALVPDGAYWVDEIRPRNSSSKPEGDMVVDLTSYMCTSGRAATTMQRDAGVDPVPWAGQEAVTTDGVPFRPGDRISGTLTNIASLVIDVRAACLSPSRPIDLDVQTDGPTLVRFSDGRRPVHLPPR